MKEDNIVTRALASLRHQTAVEEQAKAAAQAQRQAEEASRQAAEKALAQAQQAEEKARRLQNEQRLRGVCQELNIGQMVLDLQKLVSGDSGQVIGEVIEEWGKMRAIFKTYGGRQRGREIKEVRIPIGGYSEPAEFTRIYDSITRKRPGKKQVFENEATIEVADVPWTSDYSYYFKVSFRLHTPAAAVDTLFKRGARAEHSFEKDGGFHNDDLNGARTKILDAVARVADDCLRARGE